jgi:hypothetical protein
MCPPALATSPQSQQGPSQPGAQARRHGRRLGQKQLWADERTRRSHRRDSHRSRGLHSLALKRDGTLVAWGWNANGKIRVPAGLTDVTAIAAGNSYDLALSLDMIAPDTTISPQPSAFEQRQCGI